METLPLEIWVKIFRDLSPSDALHTAMANKFLWKMLTIDEIWKRFIERKFFYRFYNIRTLKIEIDNELHKYGSCFKLFNAQMKHFYQTVQIIDDVIKFENESAEYKKKHSQELEDRLSDIYTFWQKHSYVFVEKLRHMDESAYDPQTSLILSDTFKKFQCLRSSHLRSIAVASRILQAANTSSFHYQLKFARFSNDDEIEESFMLASRLDSNYFDILHTRHNILTETINEYNHHDIHKNNNLNNALLIGNIFLKKLAKYRRKVSQEKDSRTIFQPMSDEIPVFLTRLYAGDASVMSPLCYIAIAKLCMMVGIKGVTSRFPVLKMENGKGEEYMFTTKHREDTTLHISPVNPNLFINNNEENEWEKPPESTLLEDFIFNSIESFPSNSNPTQIVDYNIPNSNKTVVVLQRSQGSSGSLLTYGGFGDDLYRSLHQNYIVRMDASGRYIEESNLRMLGKRMNIVTKPLFSIIERVGLSDFNIEQSLYKDGLETIRQLQIESVIDGFKVGDMVYSSSRSTNYTVISINESTLNRENVPGPFQVKLFNRQLKEVYNEPIYTLFSGNVEKVTMYADELERQTSDGVYGILHCDEIGNYFSRFNFREYRFEI